MRLTMKVLQIAIILVILCHRIDAHRSERHSQMARAMGFKNVENRLGKIDKKITQMGNTIAKWTRQLVEAWNDFKNMMKDEFRPIYDALMDPIRTVKKVILGRCDNGDEQELIYKWLMGETPNGLNRGEMDKKNVCRLMRVLKFKAISKIKDKVEAHIRTDMSAGESFLEMNEKEIAKANGRRCSVTIATANEMLSMTVDSILQFLAGIDADWDAVSEGGMAVAQLVAGIFGIATRITVGILNVHCIPTLA